MAVLSPRDLGPWQARGSGRNHTVQAIMVPQPSSQLLPSSQGRGRACPGIRAAFIRPLAWSTRLLRMKRNATQRSRTGPGCAWLSSTAEVATILFINVFGAEAPGRVLRPASFRNDTERRSPAAPLHAPPVRSRIGWPAGAPASNALWVCAGIYAPQRCRVSIYNDAEHPQVPRLPHHAGAARFGRPRLRRVGTPASFFANGTILSDAPRKSAPPISLCCSASLPPFEVRRVCICFPMRFNWRVSRAISAWASSRCAFICLNTLTLTTRTVASIWGCRDAGTGSRPPPRPGRVPHPARWQAGRHARRLAHTLRQEWLQRGRDAAADPRGRGPDVPAS